MQAHTHTWPTLWYTHDGPTIIILSPPAPPHLPFIHCPCNFPSPASFPSVPFTPASAPGPPSYPSLLNLPSPPHPLPRPAFARSGREALKPVYALCYRQLWMVKEVVRYTCVDVLEPAWRTLEEGVRRAGDVDTVRGWREPGACQCLMVRRTWCGVNGLWMVIVDGGGDGSRLIVRHVSLSIPTALRQSLVVQKSCCVWCSCALCALWCAGHPVPGAVPVHSHGRPAAVTPQPTAPTGGAAAGRAGVLCASEQGVGHAGRPGEDGGRRGH